MLLHQRNRENREEIGIDYSVVVECSYGIFILQKIGKNFSIPPICILRLKN